MSMGENMKQLIYRWGRRLRPWIIIFAVFYAGTLARQLFDRLWAEQPDCEVSIMIDPSSPDKTVSTDTTCEGGALHAIP
jgi:hypothetical protein